MVNLIKLGNSLVRSLMASDQTRVLMKEFVNWITDLRITVILEGLTVKENLQQIKLLDFRNKEMI
jgi:EAL domain-containing protein (putative c-di-GMP-specific phosphodiesterase class I)